MLNIDGTFTELLLQLAIEILKEHTLINELTLITTTPEIYMQQFWYIINENPNINKYRFHLDNQEFELREEHFCTMLRTSQRIDFQPFMDPPLQNTLLEFIKRLDHDEIEKLLDMISQVYLEKHKEVVILMDQPQAVSPTQGTHKKSRAFEVRKTGGKGLIMRSEVVAEHVESFKTKIVLQKKKKVAPAKNVEKETYVDDPEQLIIEEEIDDDVDDTLESLKPQKLKGIKQISLAAQSLLDLKRGTKLSRQEEIIHEISRGQGKGSELKKNTQDDRDSVYSDQTLSATRLDDDVNLNRVDLEGEGDEASNYTIFVYNEKQKAKEK
ncbi:hypothetical protein Tco_1383882 [Tanacetum coccineum]